MRRAWLMAKVAGVAVLAVAMFGTLVVNAVGPCDSDDGTSRYLVCYWDAQARGNGEGVSFLVVGGGC